MSTKSESQLETRLRLEVVEGALFLQSVSAALCLSFLRGPLPRWLRPSIRAWERPAGKMNLDVSVEVSLPLLGRLIAYSGKLMLS